MRRIRTASSFALAAVALLLLSAPADAAGTAPTGATAAAPTGATMAPTADLVAQAPIDFRDPGVQIVRDATDLAIDLRPRPVDDVDVADTALVFTNLGARGSRVKCVAFGKNGAPVGRAWLKLPALGLRYLLASDLSNDRDFVGHAQCAVAAGVKGSAIFLGPGLTDLPVLNPAAPGRVRFPLVATY